MRILVAEHQNKRFKGYITRPVQKMPEPIYLYLSCVRHSTKVMVDKCIALAVEIARE